MKKTLWVAGLLIFLGAGTMHAAGSPREGGTGDLAAFCSSQKGFNLLGKFDVSWSNNGYTEKEFSMIHELGFNFVRLPIDYRTYTEPGNWDAFVESGVQEIDDAVSWGTQYDVHVCINLHRAPGYCVNSGDLPANQQLNLWEDTVAQVAFIRHWEYFADRYREVPPEILSFNLVNEPSNVTEEVYVDLMSRAIDAIHAISPDRVVFVDGMNYGRDLIPASGTKKPNPPGLWNKVRILVDGNHVEHWLNDEKVVEYDRGSDQFRELVKISKYKELKDFGELPRGHILLQEHSDEVSFRSIRIRAL